MRVRVVVQSLRGEEADESVYRKSQKDLKDNLDNIPLIPQEVRDLFQVCRLLEHLVPLLPLVLIAPLTLKDHIMRTTEICYRHSVFSSTNFAPF
jgi:hypothetical protein